MPCFNNWVNQKNNQGLSAGVLLQASVPAIRCKSSLRPPAAGSVAGFPLLSGIPSALVLPSTTIIQNSFYIYKILEPAFGKSIVYRHTECIRSQ
jgi:hypothetical protein